MNRLLWAVAGLLAVAPATAQEALLKSDAQKSSYAIGLTTAQSIVRQGVPLEYESFVLGVRDALDGTTPRLTQEEFQAALANATQSVQGRFKEQAQANLKAGREFLAKNKTAEGVTELSSGLQYKELRKGAGKHPQAGDTVVVHYTGTLLDGTEFDSSKRRGEPAEISLGSVIRGWQEAIPLMTVGSRWQVFIPPQLAYGAKGAGPIGPNETLIFEIELLDIRK
ncbi:MAG TPA: FKBP-type peptidyl-prolyl cis-trans isomerase [Gammaproteobacteria bacterium]|nr:FKBP-type peptidyl-prolyl cis-trans isomerase [Gammaproteobacteria bacterium]